jgi:hypothetical protein
MILDFTTTATARPEIISKTFASFQTNLLGVDWKNCVLHLNVDPLPAGGDRDAVVALAEEYFGHVEPNFPDAASFLTAVKWCWSQPATGYFFHLEDDWELRWQVPVEDLARWLDADAGLSCVNLRAYGFAEDEDRICLSPSLLRTAHARVMSARLNRVSNPERQLRAKSSSNPEGGSHEGFHGRQFPREPESIMIFDVGRAWLAASGWAKNNGKRFTTWNEAPACRSRKSRSR